MEGDARFEARPPRPLPGTPAWKRLASRHLMPEFPRQLAHRRAPTRPHRQSPPAGALLVAPTATYGIRQALPPAKRPELAQPRFTDFQRWQLERHGGQIGVARTAAREQAYSVPQGLRLMVTPPSAADRRTANAVYLAVLRGHAQAAVQALAPLKARHDASVAARTAAEAAAEEAAAAAAAEVAAAAAKQSKGGKGAATVEVEMERSPAPASPELPPLPVRWDIRDGSGGLLPLLALAARRGDCDVVRAMLDSGAELNAASPMDGATALHCAAQGDHARCLSLLLSHGAAVDTPTASGLSPLAVAARSGHGEMVRMLLGMEGPPMAAEEGAAPTEGASERATGALVDGGGAFEQRRPTADAMLCDLGGTSPLMWAAGSGCVGAVATMLRAIEAREQATALTRQLAQEAAAVEAEAAARGGGGAKGKPPPPKAASGNKGSDKAGVETAEMAAREAREARRLRWVREGVARALDLPDSKGHAALHYALMGGHIEVAGMLIQAGASVHASNPRSGRPLSRLVPSGCGDAEEVVSQLLARQDARDRSGGHDTVPPHPQPDGAGAAATAPAAAARPSTAPARR